jgi:alkane 1-monooxygenase
VKVLHYLKYFLFHAIGIVSVVILASGGSAIRIGLFGVIAFYVIGDAIAGNDESTPRFAHPGLLTFQLWMALPLLCLIVFTSIWTMCPGDPLSFGTCVTVVTGYDMLAARAATTSGEHFSAFVLTGLMIGMVGTIPAHELTHRTRDRISMVVGRWMLAFSFDTIFSIEHVYGHHRYVATEADPATAPRGRSVYAHILISTIRSNTSGWRIECARLDRIGLGHWSAGNRVLSGQVMSLALLVAAYAMGGWTALAFFVACGLWAKALLEIVNYMEHYGLVRAPGAPVHARHSWNTTRRISSWSMFNLTRHSHHHANAGVPYQELRSFPDAPVMINGYLTTILLTLVPPLWKRLMAPRLSAWDRDFASPEERCIAGLVTPD